MPKSGFDTLLFAGGALLVACFASSRLSALWVLFAGAALQVAAFQYNLGHLGNALSLWLGITPADVFLYVFLPPLLMYDAARIDYFLLRKVCCVGVV